MPPDGLSRSIATRWYAYAQRGRAHIRALPPFRGAARLLAVAVLAQLGDFAALFVRQIVTSVPGEGAPGVIRWKKERLGDRPRRG